MTSLPLANRKSAKVLERGKVAPSKIGGPNTGTSLDLLTATLKKQYYYYYWYLLYVLLSPRIREDR
jgi:hypothetical protein